MPMFRCISILCHGWSRQGRNALLAALASLAALILVLPASAQQPGSAGYNTVYLPAHGVGDTARPAAAERWGAFASGKAGVVGWTNEAASEQNARELAMADCGAHAGEECRVEFTFVNECAVLTRGPGNWFWRTGNQGLNRLSKMTLKQCGEGCWLVRTGCALP